MNREGIRQQAEEYRQPYRGAGYHISSMDIKEAFEEGAEWMQKQMIDMACEWIKDNVENAFVCMNGTMTETNGIELSRCIHKTMEE